MVDIQPTTTQPISDDQELAKVLAGVNQQVDDNLQFEETPAAPAPAAPVVEDTAAAAAPVAPITPIPVSGELDPIKNEAINELRPLVDKLNLPPEEKFDIYLLLIRNTDDKALIAPAHATAQSIGDESRRAQALLDIIKEIDYLSNPQQ